MGCYLMYFSQTANPLEIKLGIDLKQAGTSERQRQFSNGFCHLVESVWFSIVSSNQFYRGQIFSGTTGKYC